ncbi:MAG: exodeoxyribonuclease V subunit gamma, partial [Burkholderiaceae bacterium]|nr:exodeoxyribonuclease V subunit gamma [Burkholderiaceae bacterium]
AREGLLPIGLIGKEWQRELVDALTPVRSEWLRLRERYPLPAAKLALELQCGELRVEDWLDQLRSDGVDAVWLMQISSKVLDKKRVPRGDKLIAMWLRQLGVSALGQSITGFLVARDAIVTLRPLDAQASRAALGVVVNLWRAGMNLPLPTACKTALALVCGGDPRVTYEGNYQMSGERDDLCLARLWPDFSALAQDEAWQDCSRELYGPLADWLEQHIEIAPIGSGEEAQ